AVEQRLVVGEISQRAVEVRVAVERHQVGVDLDLGDEGVELVHEHGAVDAALRPQLARRDLRQGGAGTLPGFQALEATRRVDPLQAVVVTVLADAGRELRKLPEPPGPLRFDELREARVGVERGGVRGEVRPQGVHHGCSPLTWPIMRSWRHDTAGLAGARGFAAHALSAGPIMRLWRLGAAWLQ